MINNNLAQYSFYLIFDQNIITIEAFVHFNRKYWNYENFGAKQNFTCVLKFINERGEVIYIELEAINSPKFYWTPNKKLVFN